MSRTPPSNPGVHSVSAGDSIAKKLAESALTKPPSSNPGKAPNRGLTEPSVIQKHIDTTLAAGAMSPGQPTATPTPMRTDDMRGK